MPDIVQFDPEALKKRVAETIQVSFGMLIPAEQFNAMVEKEVKAFFEQETTEWIVAEKASVSWDRNGSAQLKTTLTPFRRLVWEKVQELCKAKLNEHLSSDQFKAYLSTSYSYSTDTQGRGVNTPSSLEIELGKYFEAVMPAMSQKMAEAFFRGMFAGAAEQAKSLLAKQLQ